MRRISLFLATVILSAFAARADWTLAKGTAGVTTMTDASSHVLNVTVLDPVARTLRIGKQAPDNTSKAESNATVNKNTGWQLDFSAPITLAGSDETWTIVEIGSYAFFNNTTVTNPSTGLDLATVTNIGYAAFMYANGLTKVNLSPNLQEVGISAFTAAGGITSVNIQLPESLKKINAGAFGRHSCYDPTRHAKSLSGEVSLLGVEEIYGCAFVGASNITSLVVGPNLRVLSSTGTALDSNLVNRGPFSGMGGLQSITFEGPAPENTLPPSLFSSWMRIPVQPKQNNGQYNYFDTGAKTLVVTLYDIYTNGWVAAFRAVGTVTDATLAGNEAVFAQYVAPSTVDPTGKNHSSGITEQDGNGSTTVYLAVRKSRPIVEWTYSQETEGISQVGYESVEVSGTVRSIGPTAEACEIQAKIWSANGAEPENWTTVASNLGVGDFLGVVSGLTHGTTYNYMLRMVVGGESAQETASGTFTTLAPQAPTVVWNAPAPNYETVTFSGAVSDAGAPAETATVQCKVWAEGETEPEEWTTLVSSVADGGTFTKVVSELATGTEYSYRLLVTADDKYGLSVQTTGTFTTKGEAGVAPNDTAQTHLYVAEDESYYVVNDFERYLRLEVTGYTGTEVLTNFPVLVNVRRKDTNGFKYEDFYLKNGQDMAFVDDSGRLIPHEIDTWNETGTSLIWVRLPEMTNGTKFTMCYRSPMVTPISSPGNTFERYVGVWHLNEPEDGVVTARDSTENGLDGETHANSLATSGNNVRVGGGRRVAQTTGSASSKGRILVFNKDNVLNTVGNVFTFSAWYKCANGTPDYAYLVSRKSEDSDVGWGVQFHSSDKNKLRVWSGSGVNGTAQVYQTPAIPAYTKHDKLQYWTFSYSNNLFNAWLDGNRVLTDYALDRVVVNDENASYQNLVIGGMENGYSAFNGYIDEARYSKGMRSDDWIKAEYYAAMQVDRAFVTKADTVGMGVESLVPVIVWEQGRTLPLSIIDISYAYVQFAGTVTFCGSGADECRVEYKLWAEGEMEPESWTTLRDHLTAGDSFSIPIFGLKQDMPYSFEIRAVNRVNGVEQHNMAQTGTFRTPGNVTGIASGGELIRIANMFVHRFPSGNFKFTTPDYVTNIEIMVVGGGGAGGYKIGGGGGGGGLFYDAAFPVESNTTYRVSVGRGGVAASNLVERSSGGEYSTFSLETDREHPLIAVPGGGAGGSYEDSDAMAKGGAGASSGGGTYGRAAGEVLAEGAYGHSGGVGNTKVQGQSLSLPFGYSAAGGGGGAGRAGLKATGDNPPSGGSGGVGVGNSMTGETLFYGAGGGGGVRRYFAQTSFAAPGRGGSGIGGDAADPGVHKLATSGVPNTGAGGGGGSCCHQGSNNTNFVANLDADADMLDEKYWQGGNGGDGVVLIAYEVHGRDPISEEPQITLTSLDYTDERGYATIGYRAYWAGIQADTSDIYVLYSTVSEEDVLAGNGEMVKCAEGRIGIGSLTFTPPQKGYTYYVRLVARKDANSYMYSDEVESFECPAIRISGVEWTESKPTQISAPDTSKDFARVLYNIYDKDSDARLYCYWSENRADLEGDTEPSGEGVHFLNVTMDIAENGTNLVSATRFNVSASLGLERNKQYYFRLALANEAGTKFFLSPRIMPLWTAETAYIVFPEAYWDSYVAKIDFMLSPANYDPASVDLLVLYSGIRKDVTDGNAIAKPSVSTINLGTTDLYPHGDQTLTQFPLSSTVATNYYLRLALRLPDGKYVYSARDHELTLPHIPTNTIVITTRAIPQKRCYGDALPAFGYEVTYSGYTNTVAWEHRPSVVGAPTCMTISDDPADQEPVTAASPAGQYRIVQGTLALSNFEPYVHETTVPVLDPVTGEPVVDPETGEPETTVESVQYNFIFAYARSRYTITNAVFSASVADVSATYTGEAFSPSSLQTTETGVRNSQPVSYLFRGVGEEWSDTFSASYTDVGTRTFQFKASAPSHDDTYGTFTITIEPAPLSATISAADLNYLGVAQTPAIVTNVTGLMHPERNPLTCQFRDEAGEWLAEVPSFTRPGEYKLFFRVSATNHATFATNCVFTIEEWDYRVNMDGREGFQVLINISDPSWLLEATGKTAEQFADNTENNRYRLLDSVCANGLKLWQNYVIDRRDTGKKLVAAIRQSGDRVDANSFVAYFPNVAALRNTGLNVRFRLDRKLKGESTFTKGALTDRFETNIPLGPDDPTGLYVFNMVLTPTNSAATGEAMYGGGEAVLASVATVGVLRVSSAMTNTVTAAPWRSLTRGTEEEVDVSVSDVVNPNSGIGDGDTILAYNAATSNFNAWALARTTGDEWIPLATVSRRGLSVAAAESSRFARGRAFWLVRGAPGPYIYLVGRYTGGDYVVELEGGTAESPGHTLVANPTMFDVALNDMKFVDGEGSAAAPDDGDRIVFQGADGHQTIYYPHKTTRKWGRNVATKVGRRTQQVWTEDGTNTVGTGFWYMRTGTGDLRIKFEAGR